MFVDEVKVFARAGHGGKGCVAFLREAYRPKGGPDGGNGGRGGDVILEADHDLNNLVAQFYQPRLIAQNGEFGMGKGMDGHAGRDLVVKVPCGTMVWRIPHPSAPADADAASAQDETRSDPSETPPPPAPKPGARPLLLSSTRNRPVIRHAGDARALEIDLGSDEGPSDAGLDQRERVVDLTEHGQRFVLCKGGRGGLGNRNFANSVRQTPRFAQPGEPGEEGHYLLELRLIADIGLVGYPNAGKSTLLSAISKARPKIAPYPFTTLTPQIGIVEYPDFRRLVVCDVPGLIEGAHRNVGLGHAFLRHIQRCSVLVIVVDMAGTDGRKPWDDYRQVLAELNLYDPSLADRPRIIVANKMDEPASEANLKGFRRRIRRIPVLAMAAGFDEGIEPFKQAIRDAVSDLPTTA
ncbi:MAG: GTPase ObgE [Verrucomicrobiales bacterium]|nr:GTPase ObgE [Verrucomicrobiales bacterium]